MPGRRRLDVRLQGGKDPVWTLLESGSRPSYANKVQDAHYHASNAYQYDQIFPDLCSPSPQIQAMKLVVSLYGIAGQGLTEDYGQTPDHDDENS